MQRIDGQGDRLLPGFVITGYRNRLLLSETPRTREWNACTNCARTVLSGSRYVTACSTRLFPVASGEMKPQARKDSTGSSTQSAIGEQPSRESVQMTPVKSTVEGEKAVADRWTDSSSEEASSPRPDATPRRIKKSEAVIRPRVLFPRPEQPI
uniref:Uncharacterized protein n=1 Tax=Steinernema glaseri TaxID=37863 RepID=A0A1I7YVX2_9BILA